MKTGLIWSWVSLVSWCLRRWWKFQRKQRDCQKLIWSTSIVCGIFVFSVARILNFCPLEWPRSRHIRTIPYSSAESESEKLLPRSWEKSYNYRLTCVKMNLKNLLRNHLKPSHKTHKTFRWNLNIWKDLMENRGLKNASDLMVSGCSAGGLATYLHADQWCNTLLRPDPAQTWSWILGSQSLGAKTNAGMTQNSLLYSSRWTDQHSISFSEDPFI